MQAKPKVPPSLNVQNVPAAVHDLMHRSVSSMGVFFPKAVFSKPFPVKHDFTPQPFYVSAVSRHTFTSSCHYVSRFKPFSVSTSSNVSNAQPFQLSILNITALLSLMRFACDSSHQFHMRFQQLPWSFSTNRFTSKHLRFIPASKSAISVISAFK